MKLRLLSLTAVVLALGLCGCSSAAREDEAAALDACGNLFSAYEPVLASLQSAETADGADQLEGDLLAMERDLSGSDAIGGPPAFLTYRDELIADTEAVIAEGWIVLDGGQGEVPEAVDEALRTYAEIQRYCGQ